MTSPIELDQSVLNTEIAKLESLIGGLPSSLATQCTASGDGFLDGSTGNAATNLKQINVALDATAKQFYSLMNATLFVLRNVTTLVEADSNLARQIEDTGTAMP